MMSEVNPSIYHELTILIHGFGNNVYLDPIHLVGFLIGSLIMKIENYYLICSMELFRCIHIFVGIEIALFEHLIGL